MSPAICPPCLRYVQASPARGWTASGSLAVLARIAAEPAAVQPAGRRRYEAASVAHYLYFFIAFASVAPFRNASFRYPTLSS